MQVKKFEAKTMKEALELVKAHLGPDAIILSARDIKKAQGISGGASVEITAAVSEESLRRMKFVESRIPKPVQEKMTKAPVRSQKQIIENMVTRYQQDQEQNDKPMRYVDIQDPPRPPIYASESQVASLATRTGNRADFRIKSAAQRAWSALAEAVSSGPEATETVTTAQSSSPQTRESVPTKESLVVGPVVGSETEVNILRQELQEIKKVLAEFQKVPQSLVNSFPGAKFGLNHDMSSSFERLVGEGLSEELSGEILQEAQKMIPLTKQKNKGIIEGYLAKYFLDHTEVSTRSDSKIHVFVGPPGAGKTTSLIKLASRMVVEKGKRIALVATQSSKVGAVEQMRIFAQILNVPFAAMRTPAEWPAIRQSFNDVDHILVDCPGWTLRQIDEISMAKAWIAPTMGSRSVHLVVSSLIKSTDLSEIAKNFRVLPVTDLLFTGLDHAAQYGNIFQMMHESRWPLHAFGIGPRVPEDFEFASKERMVDLILKLSRINKKQGTENG